MNKFITDFIEGFKMAGEAAPSLNSYQAFIQNPLWGTSLGNAIAKKVPPSYGGKIAEKYPRAVGTGIIMAAAAAGLFGGKTAYNNLERDRLTSYGAMPMGQIADWTLAYNSLGKGTDINPNMVVYTPEYKKMQGTTDVLDSDAFGNAALAMTTLGYGGPKGTHNDMAMSLLKNYHHAGDVVNFFGSHPGAIYGGSKLTPEALQILGNYVDDVYYIMNRAAHGDPKYKEQAKVLMDASRDVNMSPSAKWGVYHTLGQGHKDRQQYPNYENDPVMVKYIQDNSPEAIAAKAEAARIQEEKAQEDFAKYMGWSQ